MIVIVTIGRTGSTLLQNILNQVSNSRILGELYPKRLLKKLIKKGDVKVDINDFNIKSRKGNYNKPNHPFYVPVNFNIRNNIDEFNNKNVSNLSPTERLKILLPKDRQNVGFKILIEHEEIEEIILNYDIKFLFLIRDKMSIINSMKRAGFKKSIKYVNENIDNYKEIYNKYKDTKKIFLIDYNDIVISNDNFKNMFKFLNINYDSQKIKESKRILCSYAQSNIVKRKCK